ncbi:MAG: glycosyltransferase family 2 protein [Deltaproteobacteria bacterium]|nr:glycosyltransferase family 2 protein [Deltaproteobacteria bacterium]
MKQLIKNLQNLTFIKKLRKLLYLRPFTRSMSRRVFDEILGPFGCAANHYSRWLKKQSLTPKKIDKIKDEISGFKYQPKISVIMPVFNVAPQWLELAIESVTQQIYEEWELCIVDDCSSNPETINYLRSVHHPKIKIKFLDRNQGISGASSEAIQMMTGEYIALLDDDDVITKDTLYEVVKVINTIDPDLIYSDEDRIDHRGVRAKPFFKPDWSPDLLRAQNYICHFTVIKKAIYISINGFRKGVEAAQDHDLILRAVERSNRIHHIPKVLYSWREIETSTAAHSNAKPLAQSSGLKAVDEHMERYFGGEAYVKESQYKFVYDANTCFNGSSLVSIIIPTKDGIRYLKDCISSILTKSSYKNYEILILNNNSEKQETQNYFKEITTGHSNIRVVDASYPFCWSRLNNQGVSESKGDVFIFLNNDTRIISNDWIERLAGQAIRKDVGVVGPLMLYEDGTIQHAGVVVGLGGWADHLFRGMKPNHTTSPFVSPMVKRNVLAVTGSCMAVSRETMNIVGGFDERFMVCGSDVALCIRAYEMGLYNIYDPFVKLYHFESKTRIPDDIPNCDFEMSKIYYKKYLETGDPFFNINLSLSNTRPTLR